VPSVPGGAGCGHDHEDVERAWQGPDVVPVRPVVVVVDGARVLLEPTCPCGRPGEYWLDGIDPWCGLYGCSQVSLLE